MKKRSSSTFLIEKASTPDAVETLLISRKHDASNAETEEKNDANNTDIRMIYRMEMI
jgi:hypothetical protein